MSEPKLLQELARDFLATIHAQGDEQDAVNIAIGVLLTRNGTLQTENEKLKADADKFAVHMTMERWTEITDEHTSLLADVQQLRAALAAVEDYADYVHHKWRNNTPAFSFAIWYAANHTEEAQP